jgi:hypothetical protein
MKLFKKNTPKVPKTVLFSWLKDKLDTNLLRWGGYKNKEDYEHEIGRAYDKDKYILENLDELEEIYLIRQNPNFQAYSRGGSTNRSIRGERPLSALKQDRKYTSEQEWEKSYRSRRVSDVLRYKHHPKVVQKSGSKSFTSTKNGWKYTIGGL